MFPSKSGIFQTAVEYKNAMKTAVYIVLYTASIYLMLRDIKAPYRCAVTGQYALLPNCLQRTVGCNIGLWHIQSLADIF